MSESKLERIGKRLDRVTELTGSLVAWLVVLLVVTTGLVVLLRYAFQTGSIALQESLIYINALIFTLGSAYTLKHDGHVRVDIFYNKYSPRGKALLNLGGILFLLFPFCAVVLWTSWDYVAISWQIRERSAETSGLPIVYLLKTTILLMAGILIWQGVSELLKNLAMLQPGKRQ